MIEVKISDHDLSTAAGESIDTFLDLIIGRTREAIGGELTSENMPRMSSKQVTLIGYAILRDELMDGGFIQLIHNGYGPFFFHNPFDRAVREWGEQLEQTLGQGAGTGLIELCHFMRRARKPYQKYRDEITRDMSDEDFMALYEQFPAFEDLDDEFVSNEEQWSHEVAAFVDDHLEDFVSIF